MQESLMSQGISLLITGMGTVVVFLGVLVVLTTLASRLISKYLPEPIVEPKPAAPRPVRASQPADPRVIKIIQQAIEQHRSKTP